MICVMSDFVFSLHIITIQAIMMRLMKHVWRYCHNVLYKLCVHYEHALSAMPDLARTAVIDHSVISCGKQMAEPATPTAKLWVGVH